MENSSYFSEKTGKKWQIKGLRTQGIEAGNDV
jgi:hypothetical protein